MDRAHIYVDVFESKTGSLIALSTTIVCFTYLILCRNAALIGAFRWLACSKDVEEKGDFF